jgi:hypothetical protein
MWTETPEGRAFITDITKTVVSQVAPEELDLFDELLQEYFRNPQPFPPAAPSDDPLGFGVGEVIVAVTSVTVPVLITVLEFLAAATIKATMEEGAELTVARARKLFPRMLGKMESPTPLTQTQLIHVTNLARQQALTCGIEESVAEKMATALIGALVLTKVD